MTIVEKHVGILQAKHPQVQVLETTVCVCALEM